MTPLPRGTRIVLDPSVRHGRGGTLTGGWPRRVMRLSPAGQRALQDLQRGDATSDTALELGRRLVNAAMAHPRPAPRDCDCDVTVVVPVRDRPLQLERCLGALGAGTAVIVVDDGSRDHRTVAATAARHAARLVRRQASGGPAAARNAALPLVGTEFVAFLDSDCVAPRTWLRVLLGHFDDPLVAAAAPRVRPHSLPSGGLIARYLATRCPLDMGASEARVLPGGAVPYVPTAALVVRRSTLGEGFDDGLRVGEDVDLVWRLHDAGYQVRYDPSVQIEHSEPATLGRLLARRFRYGTAAASLEARHPRRVRHLAVRPWPAIAALSLLLRRPGVAAVIAAQQSALISRRLRNVGPNAQGVRWFTEAMLDAVVSVGRYVATLWLPVAIIVLSRRSRLTGLGLLLMPVLYEWLLSETDLDLLRWTALVLADDAAYGAGVWSGCVKARRFGSLMPAINSRR